MTIKKYLILQINKKIIHNFFWREEALNPITTKKKKNLIQAHTIRSFQQVKLSTFVCYNEWCSSHESCVKEIFYVV